MVKPIDQSDSVGQGPAQQPLQPQHQPQQPQQQQQQPQQQQQRQQQQQTTLHHQQFIDSSKLPQPQQKQENQQRQQSQQQQQQCNYVPGTGKQHSFMLQQQQQVLTTFLGDNVSLPSLELPLPPPYPCHPPATPPVSHPYQLPLAQQPHTRHDGSQASAAAQTHAASQQYHASQLHVQSPLSHPHVSHSQPSLSHPQVTHSQATPGVRHTSKTPAKPSRAQLSLTAAASQPSPHIVAPAPQQPRAPPTVEGSSGGQQHGGSQALFVPPNRGDPRATTRRDSLMMQFPGSSGWTNPPYKTDGLGWDSFMSLDPPKGFVYEDSLDEMIRDLPMAEPPLGPPVAQYPQRTSFVGMFGLRITFPGEGPKLVVSADEGGGRRLNTEMGHGVLTVVQHSAGANTGVRFLLVYTKDSETSSQVNPCKNHQNPLHPKHMLEVRSGAGEPVWDEEPHPSVVVTPAPCAQGEYSVQLRFLCRNSCNTRKDLTLICQLERQGQVVGRECLQVKVSACPKRDAGHQRDCTTTTIPQGPRKRPRTTSGHDCHTVPPHDTWLDSEGSSDQNTPDCTLPPLPPPETGEARTAARRMAYLTVMEHRFRELHPESHRRADHQFGLWWDAGGLG